MWRSLLALLTTSSLLSVHSLPQGETAKLSPKGQKVLDETTKWQESTGNGWDKLAAKALVTLVKDALKNGWPSEECTLEDVYVRKEWGALSAKEKREYIDAVLCLQSRPSQLDPALYPGARNRYDDFVGVHITQTMTIHLTGNFLTWHRYFTWAYEWTLRNECGYKGYQPYINWGKHTVPQESAIFDGSDLSMSGDGVTIPGYPDLVILPETRQFVFEHKNGGGCLYNGPFKNWTVNLGPLGSAYSDITPNPQMDGLGYNPRCLRRVLSAEIGTTWNTDEKIVKDITTNDDITGFQGFCEGRFDLNYFGVHSGGHYLIGGDPGSDFFASPGDPYFFLHHSAIDRFWWTWQNLKPQDRTYVVGFTRTFNNTPPSDPATLDDPVELGAVGLAGEFTIRSLSSSIKGGGSPFCYIYA